MGQSSRSYLISVAVTAATAVAAWDCVVALQLRLEGLTAAGWLAIPVVLLATLCTLLVWRRDSPRAAVIGVVAGVPLVSPIAAVIVLIAAVMLYSTAYDVPVVVNAVALIFLLAAWVAARAILTRSQVTLVVVAAALTTSSIAAFLIPGGVVMGAWAGLAMRVRWGFEPVIYWLYGIVSAVVAQLVAMREGKAGSTTLSRIEQAHRAERQKVEST